MGLSKLSCMKQYTIGCSHMTAIRVNPDEAHQRMSYVTNVTHSVTVLPQCMVAKNRRYTRGMMGIYSILIGNITVKIMPFQQWSQDSFAHRMRASDFYIAAYLLRFAGKAGSTGFTFFYAQCTGRHGCYRACMRGHVLPDWSLQRISVKCL
jgi:hypothetical protein